MSERLAKEMEAISKDVKARTAVIRKQQQMATSVVTMKQNLELVQISKTKLIKAQEDMKVGPALSALSTTMNCNVSPSLD